jgi:hypothetical protein
VVHGADSSDRTKCRKGRLLRQLHQLHALRSKVFPGDRIFFIASTSEDDEKIDLFVQSHGPLFIHTGLFSSRANAMRFMPPPEDPVPSLTTSMLFGQQCPVSLVSLITEHRLLYNAGPLVQGPALKPNARSQPTPTGGNVYLCFRCPFYNY